MTLTRPFQEDAAGVTRDASTQKIEELLEREEDGLRLKVRGGSDGGCHKSSSCAAGGGRSWQRRWRGRLLNCGVWIKRDAGLDAPLLAFHGFGVTGVSDPPHDGQVGLCGLSDNRLCSASIRRRGCFWQRLGLSGLGHVAPDDLELVVHRVGDIHECEAPEYREEVLSHNFADAVGETNLVSPVRGALEKRQKSLPVIARSVNLSGCKARKLARGTVVGRRSVQRILQLGDHVRHDVAAAAAARREGAGASLNRQENMRLHQTDTYFRIVAKTEKISLLPTPVSPQLRGVDRAGL